MTKTLYLKTLMSGYSGESAYKWSEGGFLDFEQFALATIQGVLNAGATVTAMEVI